MFDLRGVKNLSIQHTDFLTTVLTAYMIFLFYREYVPFMKDRKRIESLGKPLDQFNLNRSRVNTKLYVIIAIFVILTNFLSIDHLIDRMFVAVMMIHTLFLWYQASRSVLVFKSGIYFNSRFVTWYDISRVTQTEKKLTLNVGPNGSLRLVNRDLLDVGGLKSLIHQFQTTETLDKANYE